MEPVLGGRDDVYGFFDEPAIEYAAMEPVLGGRDDSSSTPGRRSRRAGRNGARPWRTGRPGCWGRAPEPGQRPQWSPSLADGTTTEVIAGPNADITAAMEPVLGGRDDPGKPSGPGRHGGAAMEPVLGGRDDPAGDLGLGLAAQGRNGARPWRTGRPGNRRIAADGGGVAAMEPVLGGRDDPAGGRCLRRITASRNGARPWRTGRRDAHSCTRRVPRTPQWSPSLADGTTRRPRGTVVPALAAAMEPVLGGRDDRATAGNLVFTWAQPQWSPSLADGTTTTTATPTPTTSCRRNGARPWRTGRLSRCIVGPDLSRSRNGARPWRTGRPRRARPGRRLFRRRNGARPWRTGRLSVVSRDRGIRLQPQWSPSLADGTTRLLGRAGTTIYGRPQWSPSLADGTTIRYGARLHAAS